MTSNDETFQGAYTWMNTAKLISDKTRYEVTIECPQCGEQSIYLTVPPPPGEIDDDL